MRAIAPVILAAFILPGFLSSCRDTPEEDPDVLAVISEHRLTEQQVLDELERRREKGRPIGGKVDLIEEMVEYQSLLEYAKLQGVDEDPDFQRSVDNLLIGMLKEKELSSAMEAITVSNEELETTYEARRDTLERPGALRLSVIKVSVRENSSPERLAEARSRLDAERPAAITGDDGFRKAAARISDDQASRYRGGDIGWCVDGRSKAGIPSEVLEAGRQLPADGDVSEVIRADDGFYLVKRVATRKPSVPSLEELGDRLRSELIREKRQAIQAAFDEKVRSAVEVRRFPERIESLDLGLPTNQSEGRPPANP